MSISLQTCGTLVAYFQSGNNETGLQGSYKERVGYFCDLPDACEDIAWSSVAFERNQCLPGAGVNWRVAFWPWGTFLTLAIFSLRLSVGSVGKPSGGRSASPGLMVSGACLPNERMTGEWVMQEESTHFRLSESQLCVPVFTCLRDGWHVSYILKNLCWKAFWCWLAICMLSRCDTTIAE